MGYGRTRNVVPVTIANGAQLSSDAACGALRLVGIIMPATWDGGNLGLEAVVDQSATNPPVPTWGAVVDQAGAPIVLATAPANGEYVAIPDTFAVVALGVVRLTNTIAVGAQRIVRLVFTD